MPGNPNKKRRDGKTARQQSQEQAYQAKKQDSQSREKKRSSVSRSWSRGMDS